MSAPTPSPCVLICQIEPRSGYCYGCGRNMDEISGWGTMSAQEREVIMAALPERMELLPKRERRVTKRRERQRLRTGARDSHKKVGEL